MQVENQKRGPGGEEAERRGVLSVAPILPFVLDEPSDGGIVDGLVERAVLEAKETASFLEV